MRPPIEREVAAGTVRIESTVCDAQGEQILRVLIRVREGPEDPARQLLPNAQAPLRGVRNLELVVDQPELRSSGRVSQRIQGGFVGGEISIIPCHFTADWSLSPGSETHSESRMRNLLFFVDRYVEGDSIVIQTPAPEDRRAFCFVDRI